MDVTRSHNGGAAGQDAVYFSPYLWRCVDLPFSALFFLLLLPCLVLSYFAKWQIQRSTLGARRWVLYAVVLAELITYGIRIYTEALEIRQMDYVGRVFMGVSRFISYMLHDLSRAAVFCILMRTATAFLRARFVPELRMRYEMLKVFTAAPCIAYAVVTPIVAVLLAMEAEGTPDNQYFGGSDDEPFGYQAIYTAIMDINFWCLNGVMLLLVMLYAPKMKQRKPFLLYYSAALIFQTQCLFSVVLNFVVQSEAEDSWARKRPAFTQALHWTLARNLAYVYDIAISRALMLGGLYALLLFGRLHPSLGVNDHGLVQDIDVQTSDYTDDEPERAPNHHGQLVDVSDDDSRQRQQETTS